eukprot:gnl/TRDRNA2_/TRDRNA2_28975_c0_seq1.p1 gnl/TRDRNA2_/TRDRNA2_28975_c0~~gnl/TRDRNA2_/TRDRNA2_28975_c0_seq1.p1  ORF type:complete len:245 (-),score=37.70 gnl/TRDRNA2_/TRDRNA2_28975_c0_seq1:36-770(-)
MVFVCTRIARGLTGHIKGHSAQWIHRHVTDKYVRLAAQEMYRSRSAYKLKQLDDKYSFFRPRSIVLDLGCFSGGWSQVALERVGTSKGAVVGRVVGVDKVQMTPLEHHRFVLGDVTEEETMRKIFHELGHRAHVVLSDMAPTFIGSKVDDHIASVDLCRKASKVVERTLREGGWYVTKVFAGQMADQYRKELESRFKKVRIAKPAASRPASREHYLVCSSFLGGGYPLGDTGSRIDAKAQQHLT